MHHGEDVEETLVDLMLLEVLFHDVCDHRAEDAVEDDPEAHKHASEDDDVEGLPMVVLEGPLRKSDDSQNEAQQRDEVGRGLNANLYDVAVEKTLYNHPGVFDLVCLHSTETSLESIQGE